VPPSWRGPGRDWGNLTVCYPTGVIAAEDPRLARLDARKSMERARTGLISSGHADSLHTYLGADLAQWALLAGRPAEARRWLHGILAHSSSTLGQAEIFHRDGGFGLNMPPHGTAAATLVDLVRNMIVCDVRDTLELGLGGDAGWWAGTKLTRAGRSVRLLAENHYIVLAIRTPAVGKHGTPWILEYCYSGSMGSHASPDMH